MIITETKIRVRYADTDQMKMVYYAKYFEYFEQGRSDLLRILGMPYPEIEKLGYFLPVIEAHSKYSGSARYDELLVIKTMLKEVPKARVRIEYEIRKDSAGALLTEGYTVHTFIDSTTGRPTRAPEQFLQLVRDTFTTTP